MFSILILTKDEEINLPACLESVGWCDDVVVLDSLSEDRTQELAEKSGARVYERPFDDFGSQRNHALDQIKFRHPWVFHLDADERFNEELRRECERVIREDQHSAFFVPNKIIFLGRWIRHSTQYPYPQVRLLKVGEVRFAKAGHGQREDQVKRSLGHIDVAYDHYNFSKGISDWVQKHNRYSDEEAKHFNEQAEQSIQWPDLLKGGMARKRAMKQVHARVPFRWVFKFIYLYFVRLGILDGYPGFVYCVLQSFYDFLITVKIQEAKTGTSRPAAKAP
ncbi:glycosyltransferase family 2 protein [Haloferula chungangensis]|uniref:Glycosyltransferase family 2 protein n=1 Tax=Haloferula chungangensis TaxID=1048331 RepID=A0ABW2LAY6_9BACT